MEKNRMSLIATLPPPHLKQMKEVAENAEIDAFRFNTGSRSPLTPYMTIRKILERVPKENFWIDIKGRQIRIDMWAVPTFGDIILNRNIKVDLPAMISLRNGETSQIVELQGKKIYLDPIPRYVVGAGQSVNIIGNNFNVLGDYLTDIDKQYIEAGRELGVSKYMLSFLEKGSDIAEVLAIDPGAEICGKIESPAGLKLIKNGSWSGKKMQLMAARDDLFINVGFNAKKMFEAQRLIIKKDPKAIAASRILTSLERDEEVSLSDLSDVYLLREMGYSNFLLSDGLCSNPVAFQKAVSILRSF